MIEFGHGYTYSAHPIACAAGVSDKFDYRIFARRRRSHVQPGGIQTD